MRMTLELLFDNSVVTLWADYTRRIRIEVV